MDVLICRHNYHECDNPHIWVPTLALYTLYVRAVGPMFSGPYASHAIDEHGRMLTIRQFGRCIRWIWPHLQPVTNRIAGIRYRGVSGIRGDVCAAIRGWDQYPMQESLPSDWTPTPVDRILPLLDVSNARTPE